MREDKSPISDLSKHIALVTGFATAVFLWKKRGINLDQGIFIFSVACIYGLFVLILPKIDKNQTQKINLWNKVFLLFQKVFVFFLFFMFSFTIGAFILIASYK